MAWRLIGAKPLSQLMLEYCWINFSEILVIEENTFKYVVCEMLSITSRPQCVNSPFHIFSSPYGNLTGFITVGNLLMLILYMIDSRYITVIYDMTCPLRSTTITMIKLRSNLALSNDTLHLASRGELWGVFREFFKENDRDISRMHVNPSGRL